VAQFALAITQSVGGPIARHGSRRGRAEATWRAYPRSWGGDAPDYRFLKRSLSSRTRSASVCSSRRRSLPFR
jgi:hypothetical protein